MVAVAATVAVTAAGAAEAVAATTANQDGRVKVNRQKEKGKR
jgi:hypothetical protein